MGPNTIRRLNSFKRGDQCSPSSPRCPYLGTPGVRNWLTLPDASQSLAFDSITPRFLLEPGQALMESVVGKTIQMPAALILRSGRNFMKRN